MPKFIYCSNCGTKLTIIRKALKGYGRIIELIDPHECPEEPLDLDLTPTEVPVNKETDGKFVEKLNNLRPSQVNTADLRDRRKESDIKTSAPASVIQQTKNLMNFSEPENKPEGDPDE